MDKRWNYNGPAGAKIKAVDDYLETKQSGEMTDEVKQIARGMCIEAIGIDGSCFPAYVYLGNLDWMDGDYESMIEQYLNAIDRCDTPFGSPWFIDGIFETLYGQLRTRPENWRLISILWERIHGKNPQFESLVPLTIACRHSGDPRAAHHAIDVMQRANPKDSIKLAKLALKKLKDSEKAVTILEVHLSEYPEDGKASRYLANVRKKSK